MVLSHALAFRCSIIYDLIYTFHLKSILCALLIDFYFIDLMKCLAYIDDQLLCKHED